MQPPFRSWLDAWLDAAYADQGFWRHAQPAAHFRTASTTSAQLAEAVLDLLAQHPQVPTVVEIGAGDGRLLAELGWARPDLRLHGVDLRDAPDGLPGAVGWCRDHWDVRTGGWTCGTAERLFAGLPGPALVVCAEWLDDLPCAVASRTERGLLQVEVDPSGRERLGAPVGHDLSSWAERWSPAVARLEIGTTRDQAWSWVCRALRPHGGLALLVDYGHLASGRPHQGTLSAYRLGRQVTPRPTPDLNLTAAVAVDSLANAGHLCGASTLLLAPQRDLLPAPRPNASDALATLVARTQHAALTSPHIWGAHYWLLQSIPPAAPSTHAG